MTRPERAFRGPHKGTGPDLIVGYGRGYRSSWESPLGGFSATVFEDNDSVWSGDHCIDPRLVPGVLFCNRKIDVEDPALIDIAPTALQQFGLTPPKYMDGKVLFKEAADASG